MIRYEAHVSLAQKLVIGTAICCAAVACNESKANEGRSAPKNGDRPAVVQPAAPVKDDKPAGANAPTDVRMPYPGTSRGLEALLATELTKSDFSGALTALRPSDADISAVFVAQAVDAVARHTAKMFANVPTTLGKPGDQVQVNSVTVEDLENETATGQRCPGEYKRLASKLQRGTTLYCAKLGNTAHDAFTHVNGHWVWFPQVFRAFE